MDFLLAPEQQRFQQEVRAFLEETWPEEHRGGYAGPGYTDDVYEREAAFRRQLARKGWLGISLPTEYGGGGRPPIEQFLLAEEASYFGAPYSNTAIGYVAPTLLRYGSEEQKRTYIPMITSGKLDFCLGYSEPNAGSDLASLQTRAVREGDSYVINGQKIYTSGAHKAEYCWLAARTDPTVPKHRGISLFIVDMKTPGIAVRPLYTFGDTRTNETFWDNVVIPASSRVGNENEGWYYLTTALDYERFNGFPVGWIRYLLEQILAYLRTSPLGQQQLRDDPTIEVELGEMAAATEAAYLLRLRLLWMTEQGIVPNQESSVVKVVVTELFQRITVFGTRLMGAFGQLEADSRWAPLQGRFERVRRAALMPTFAGGSNEIQRGIIATRGLGLPRS